MNLEHEFFSRVFYHNTVESWLIALLYIAGSIIGARLLYLLSGKVVKKITEKTKSRLDDILIEKLEGPLITAIILGGFWAGLRHLELTPSIDKAVSFLYKILVVLNGTWLVYRIISGLLSEFLSAYVKGKNHFDKHIFSLAQKVLGAILWTIGGILALNNAGVNVGALLAGLGIGGLAFALAAQDTVKNIFGGITIFTDKPFRLGDTVNLSGYIGTIEDIGMRSIRLRTLQGRLVTIPNYKTVDGNIENITLQPTCRIDITLGLTYDTTPEQMETALKILQEMPQSIPEITPTVSASFINYNSSSLDIACFYFIRKGNDIPSIQSKVNLHILKRYNENKLNFAFPTQTVYLEK